MDNKHLSKDIKYLLLCQYASGLFSTCTLRQYFAIVLGKDGRVVGTGYNGAPPGLAHCFDGACPRAFEQTTPGQDYSNCVAAHAETNALIFSDRTARMGGTLYVNGYPCYDCAKVVASCGIARLVVIENSYSSWPLSREMISAAGIEITEYKEQDLDHES